MFMSLLGPLVGLVAGGITKRISKKKGSNLHKVLAPVAAILGAGGTALATGEDPESGGLAAAAAQDGSMAVLIQSLWRGLLNAFRS